MTRYIYWARLLTKVWNARLPPVDGGEQLPVGVVVVSRRHDDGHLLKTLLHTLTHKLYTKHNQRQVIMSSIQASL